VNDLLLLDVPALRCQADPRCDRAPCFQVRLEAAARRPVHRSAELCAEHLGTAAALAAWAREQGLDGQLTVLAIDQPAPSPAGRRACAGDRVHRGFAFGAIPLNP
jgi:hypothetical protein